MHVFFLTDRLLTPLVGRGQRSLLFVFVCKGKGDDLVFFSHLVASYSTWCVCVCALFLSSYWYIRCAGRISIQIFIHWILVLLYQVWHIQLCPEMFGTTGYSCEYRTGPYVSDRNGISRTSLFFLFLNNLSFVFFHIYLSIDNMQVSLSPNPFDGTAATAKIFNSNCNYKCNYSSSLSPKRAYMGAVLKGYNPFRFTRVI